MNKTSDKVIKRIPAAIYLAFACLLFSISAVAQDRLAGPPTEDKFKRLKASSTVSGTIGGESHDSYVVRARKGQTFKVQISWQSEDNNKAQFVVSRSANFFAGDLVQGGRETYDGKNWTGKVAKTGDHYIYVTAHPQATYKLKVSVK